MLQACCISALDWPPYYQFGLAQRKGGGPQWQSAKDLTSKRVGVLEGYDNGPELAKQTTTPRLPLYMCFNTSPRAQAMLQALNAGLKKVDVNAVAQTYARASTAGKRT